MALTLEDLRRRTLGRQFPAIAGRDEAAVLELFGRLGPIQSQVPRAPFLAASSRLPGVRYETVRGLLARHVLLKATNIRGTVHTSTTEQFGPLDAVATATRRGVIRSTWQLDRISPDELTDEIERFCAYEWQPRGAIVAHITEWLRERDPTAGVDPRRETYAANVVWGHSALIRRPRDAAWERRTDAFHRAARSVVPGLARPDPGSALRELTATYLGTYGPATRADIAFFFGVGLGAAAAATLGSGVVALTGPEGEPYLDVADAPPPSDGPAGVRLLPEYDGLLVGYHGSHRNRFVSPSGLDAVWAKVNGLFRPLVLRDGIVAGTWSTTGAGRRVAVDVTPLPGHHLDPDDLLPAVSDLATALDLEVLQTRITPT